MNILIVGSGGREHALAWKIKQSPLLSKLFIAPGNPGTSTIGTNLNLDTKNFNQLKEAVLQHQIGMVVVGPEQPLVDGIHDFFQEDEELKHIPVIGPSKQGAMLEGSKAFAKGFMKRHGIPTAQYQTFQAHEKNEAVQFLQTLNAPYVLKADGLAAGKGVIICDSLQEAEEGLTNFFQGQFGQAGNTVVIEEFLNGIEVSAFVLSDGKNYVMLPEAKDYKRIGDNDTGPNTGGMGAVSPVPFYSDEFKQKIEEQIVKPTINGLAEEGICYKGFIFIGLMNVNGSPYVIEYNARMGDPETQAVMPRLKTDLLQLLLLAANQELEGKQIEFIEDSAVAVVLVSGGYPNDFQKGIPISLKSEVPNSLTFHAGTKNHEEKGLVTWGGRVMASVGIGKTMEDAIQTAYNNASQIEFEGKYLRSDIGKDLL